MPIPPEIQKPLDPAAIEEYRRFEANEAKAAVDQKIEFVKSLAGGGFDRSGSKNEIILRDLPLTGKRLTEEGAVKTDHWSNANLSLARRVIGKMLFGGGIAATADAHLKYAADGSVESFKFERDGAWGDNKFSMTTTRKNGEVLKNYRESGTFGSHDSWMEQGSFNAEGSFAPNGVEHGWRIADGSMLDDTRELRKYHQITSK